jgi:hypothetical protein
MLSSELFRENRLDQSIECRVSDYKLLVHNTFGSFFISSKALSASPVAHLLDCGWVVGVFEQY